MPEFTDGTITGLELTEDKRTAVITVSFKYGPPERYGIWREGDKLRHVHEFDAERATRALESAS